MENTLHSAFRWWYKFVLLFARRNLLIVSQDSFDILFSLSIETSSDNPPFGFFTHFHPVVLPLLKNCCAGPDWGILFTCHMYKAIDEKIMVTAVLMMDSKVARLVFFFFMANTSQVWTLTTSQLTKIWNYDYHNCITQRWKIVVSNVICWHRLRCTIVEKTLDAEKYCCKENR